MKKVLLLAVMFLGLGTIAQAQEVKITASVQKAFDTKFEGAEDVDWELEDGVYTAYFIFKDNYTQATFSSNGTWKETLTTLDEKALPTDFTSMLEKKFEEFSYNDVSKLETPNKTYFEVEVEATDRVIYYKVDENGKVLSKKEEVF